MATVDNEQLVQQFRNYLEKASADQKELSEKLDLFSFYSEIIALKNEVKIESRLIKQGLDDFKETATLIKQGIAGLNSQVRKSEQDQEHTADTANLTPLLHGLIDLYDRIQASLHALPEKRTEGLLFRLGFCRSNDDKVIRSMREGQSMLLERILALLAGCGVIPIKAVGRRFDPQTMRAVGTDSLPEVDDGLVSAERRTGFTWNGEVLRPAEVRVNRTTDR